MHRLYKSIIALVFISLGLIVAPPLYAAGTEESVANYVSEITVNQDSSLNVVETISYDFGINQRHGIFRNIPYKYKARGGNFKLRLSDFKVTDEAGQAINFEKSTSGNDVVLKIGDPDKTITGQHQ